MTIKDLLGEQYKEGMTMEEMDLAIGEKKFVDPETLPKSVKKDVFDKTASELTKYKKELLELKNTQMTGEEQLKQKLEEAETLKLEYSLAHNKVKAEEIFVKGGLTPEEIEKLLTLSVSEDVDSTVAKAQSLMDVILNKTEIATKKTKEDLLKLTPNPGGNGNPDKPMAKEEFKKLNYKERFTLREKQPELYKKLTE